MGLGNALKKEAEAETTKLEYEIPPALPRLKFMRLTFMVMLCTLVALLVASTWHFTNNLSRFGELKARRPYGLGDDNAFAMEIGCRNKAAESLRRDIMDRTVHFLQEVFQLNAYAAKYLAGLLEKDLLGDGRSLESFSKIRAASFTLFKTIPFLTSIGATSANGLTGLHVREGFSLTGQLTGKVAPVYVYTKSTEGRPCLYVENVNMTTGDSVGNALEYHHKDRDYVRQRFFSTAVSGPHGELAWHITTSEASGVPYIQSSIPVVIKKSTDVTVIHCSHDTSAFTKHLNSSIDLQGGIVFVLNEMGEVVFTSEGDYCATKNKTESRECKENSLVWKALSFLDSNVRLTGLAHEEFHFQDVLVDGVRHSLDSWPQSVEGVNLAVVVMIPPIDVGERIDHQTCVVRIAVPALVLGVGILCCILVFLLLEQVSANMRLRFELERQINATRRAEASGDAKTAFLSHMSHELRTPMACIIGLLDILLGELKMSEHLSSVRQIHRCATSLVGLLNSALDIAKVEAGKLELEIAEFDLESELTSLLEVFSVQCDAKGLHIALQLSDDIPKIVKGDSARVMQIFTNLIGNSVKFTSHGRIIIRGWLDSKPSDFTSTTRKDENQVMLRFEVDDTGPGIEEGLRERVFENFVQGAVSVPRTHGGTGLGLAIVRSLVHLMGGEIKIGEKVGRGTLFQFSLCLGLSSEHKNIVREVMKRREIVLGMPDKDCSSVIAGWMELRRLGVQQVNTWDETLLQLDFRRQFRKEGKNESRSPLLYKEENSEESRQIQSLATEIRECPRRTKSDTNIEKPVLIIDVDLLPFCKQESKYLATFEELGFNMEKSEMAEGSCKVRAVVWVLSSKTPESLRNALSVLSRSTSRSFLVRRPFHPARLREVFHELDVREKLFQSEIKMSQISKSGVSSFTFSQKIRPLDVGPVISDENTPPGADGTEGSINQVEPAPAGGETSRSNSCIFLSGSKKLASETGPRYPLLRSHSDDATKYVGEAELLLASCPLKGLNILVAEDHLVLRMLATTLLKKLGATPFTACDGKEAFNAVVTRFEKGIPPFNCILMDCQMPVMDGYDACKAIREFEDGNGQRTCIIALTANAMASDEKRCFRVGMDAFLTKPMEKERLVEVLLSTLKPSHSGEVKGEGGASTG